jgi:sigma-E factor negative regulatory protein RseC
VLIRETGEIIASEGGIATMRPGSRAGCARCAAGEGCGGGLNAWMLADRLDLIECRYEGAVPRAGETVTVEIDETSLLAAASLAYGLPLVSMVLTAVLANAFATWQAVGSIGLELSGILGAIVGLLLGGLLANHLARRGRTAARLIPTLIRADLK